MAPRTKVQKAALLASQENVEALVVSQPQDLASQPDKLQSNSIAPISIPPIPIPVVNINDRTYLNQIVQGVQTDAKIVSHLTLHNEEIVLNLANAMTEDAKKKPEYQEVVKARDQRHEDSEKRIATGVDFLDNMMSRVIEDLKNV